MPVIDWNSGQFLLGHDGMDATHAEFANLLNRLALAEAGDFTHLFDDLLEHTEAHFAREESLMLTTDFPTLVEHRAEHWRVLGELRLLGRRVRQGKAAMARRYVCEQLPDWFAVHAVTMDSALSAHLQQAQT